MKNTLLNNNQQSTGKHINVTHHVTQYVFFLIKVCSLYLCPLNIQRLKGIV